MKRAFSILLALCLILSLLPVGTFATQDSANAERFVEVTRLTADRDYVLAAVNEDGSVSAITAGSGSSTASTKLSVTAGSPASVETDSDALVWHYDGSNFVNYGKYLYPTSGGSVLVYTTARAFTFADGHLSFASGSSGTYYLILDGSTFKTSNEVANAAIFRLFERWDYAILPENCTHANLEEHAAKAATCTENGYEAYWVCSKCGQDFSDAEGQSEINYPVVIPALGHDWGEWTPYNEYYNIRCCNRCGAEQSDLPIVSSGSCGESLTWTLYDNGLLVITGSGAMTSHSWPAGRVNSIVFDGDVTSVCDYAFQGCTGLTEVVIPDSVTSIGYDAFYNCSSLTSVTIPDSVMTIGSSAFSGCNSLTNVEIPDSVTSIESSLFSGCSSLKTITLPDSITYIGSSTFSGCSSLTDVEIPDSVKSIGSSAFSGCSSLTGITLPDSITSISDYVFRNCTSLTEITIPSNVTSIGSYAFSGCTGLTEITLPSRVRYIYDYAFSGCTGLTSITIPSGLHSNGLYSYAFSNCTSLSEVRGLENRSVPEYCFSGCTALTEITVGSAGNNAFSGCTSLQQAEVRGSVGSYAFKDCSSLQQAEVGGDIAEYAFNGCEALTRLTMTGGSTIGTYAVANCPALTTVALPTSLTTVEGNAFRNDTALADVHYAGTQEQWNTITIRTSGNAPLTSANIHTDCQHTETELRNAREATCTESGYTGDEVCTICGATVQWGNTISALGHDWDDGVITKAATCTEAGEMIYTCKRDASHTRTETIAALGHTWGEWIVTKEVSDTEAGEKMRTCSVCGERETREIPIPGTVSEVSVMPTTDRPEISVTINVGGTLNINVINGSMNSSYDFTATLSNSGVAQIQGYTTVNIATESVGTFTVKGLAVGTTDITIQNNNQYGSEYTRKAVIHLTVGKSGEVTPTPTSIIGPSVAVTPTTDHPKADASIAINELLTIVVTNGSSSSAYDFTATLSGSAAQLQGNATVNIAAGGTETFVVKGIADGNVDIIIQNNNSYGSQYARVATIHLTVGSGIVPTTEPTAEPTTTPVPSCTHPQTAVSGKKAATCTEAGYTGDTVCLRCGEVVAKGEAIPAKGHETVLQGKKDATCTEKGYTGDYVCSSCGVIVTKGSETAALGHEAVFRNYKAATCTVPGYTGDYVCKVCGETIATGSETDALGHEWSEWEVTIEPTETEDGVESCTCSACGMTKTRPIPALTHTHTLNAFEGKPATCSEEGFEPYWKCSGCGKFFADAEGRTEIDAPVGIPALPHTWADWVTAIPATETETGVEVRVCRVCQAIETRAIPRTSPFKDIPASAYYRDSVLWAYTHEPQITSGYDDGSFRPDQVCTRAQVVTFLWRAAGEPEPKLKLNPFRDVNESAYYYKAVLWALENGVTTGNTDTTFNPNGECTRAQVVTFLWRAAGEPETANTVNPFRDVSSSAYYYKAVLWALENGITTGNTSTTFNPTGKCTRAHVVTFLYRANT